MRILILLLNFHVLPAFSCPSVSIVNDSGDSRESLGPENILVDNCETDTTADGYWQGTINAAPIWVLVDIGCSMMVNKVWLKNTKNKARNSERRVTFDLISGDEAKIEIMCCFGHSSSKLVHSHSHSHSHSISLQRNKRVHFGIRPHPVRSQPEDRHWDPGQHLPHL